MCAVFSRCDVESSSVVRSPDHVFYQLLNISILVGMFTRHGCIINKEYRILLQDGVNFYFLFSSFQNKNPLMHNTK